MSVQPRAAPSTASSATSSFSTRKPRTKTPEQLVAEGQLCTIGLAALDLLVDDKLHRQQAQRQGCGSAPGIHLGLIPAASASGWTRDDADDARRALRRLSGHRNPEASLETARKVQNTRNPLDAAVDRITANGPFDRRVIIIGFDGEKTIDLLVDCPSTGPRAMMGILQAHRHRHRIARVTAMIQGKSTKADRGATAANASKIRDIPMSTCCPARSPAPHGPLVEPEAWIATAADPAGRR